MKWADRFTTFVEELREDLGNNLPISWWFLATRMRVANKYPYWDIVMGNNSAQ